MTAIFGNILDQALELNLQRQAINANYRHNFEPHMWMREFCTVRLQIGRGCGHTMAIRSRSKRDDLVIVPSSFHIMTMSENRVEKPTVISSTDPNAIVLRGKTFKRIWVDDASIRSDGDIRNVYVIALMHRAEQIILVG
ncbi:hypothetical protein [Xanthomonas phage X1]|nr:hypothetical protein [Xanthomonas phage X1]